jgi:hypothetical protein
VPAPLARPGSMLGRGDQLDLARRRLDSLSAGRQPRQPQPTRRSTRATTAYPSWSSWPAPRSTWTSTSTGRRCGCGSRRHDRRRSPPRRSAAAKKPTQGT